MNMRQTLTLTVVVTVDADAAAKVPDRPGRTRIIPGGHEITDAPASGIGLAAEALGEALLGAAVEMLSELGGKEVYSLAEVGRPYDDDLEPF